MNGSATNVKHYQISSCASYQKHRLPYFLENGDNSHHYFIKICNDDDEEEEEEMPWGNLQPSSQTTRSKQKQQSMPISKNLVMYTKPQNIPNTCHGNIPDQSQCLFIHYTRKLRERGSMAYSCCRACGCERLQKWCNPSHQVLPPSSTAPRCLLYTVR